MKQCPACKTTSTDETLIYCLADGTPLVAIADEQPTLVRPAAGGQMRVEIPLETAPIIYNSQTPVVRSGGGFKIVLGVIGVLLLLLLVGGGVGAYLYFNSGGNQPANTKDLKTPAAASPLPTPDETNKLKDQIANLERKINEQKNTNRTAVNASPNQPSAGTPARVNLPATAFLHYAACRTARRASVCSRYHMARLLSLANVSGQSASAANRAVGAGRVTTDIRAGFLMRFWCTKNVNGCGFLENRTR